MANTNNDQLSGSPGQLGEVELSFQTQQERRRENSQEAAGAYVQVFLLSQGDLESNDTPETADFFPLSATTYGSIPDKSTQFSGFCVCFLARFN